MSEGRISGCSCRSFGMGKRGTPWWLLVLPAGEHHLLWWPEASIAEEKQVPIQISVRYTRQRQFLYHRSSTLRSPNGLRNRGEGACQ